MLKIKWKKWMLPATIAALTLGILLTISYRTAQEIRRQSQVSSRRYATFITVLKKAEARRLRLVEENDALRQQIAGIKSGKQNPASLQLDKQVKEFKILSGELPVRGPGVLVAMDDRTATGTLIYSGDLKDILNILRYGGAEAIAINGQRVVATTAIHEAGRNLLINRIPVNRTSGIPYEIAAIGDAAKLEGYLRSTYGLIGDLEASGVKINISTEDQIEIPAYTGGYVFKKSVPVKGKT